MLPNLRIRIRLDERQLTEVVLDKIYRLIGPFGTMEGVHLDIRIRHSTATTPTEISKHAIVNSFLR